ncbi:hypothetical protein HWV62_20412 [Athelia sp. TMB]|nr:hypothetical protein HWV62_20412 [Athelia sp. TMB]
MSCLPAELKSLVAAHLAVAGCPPCSPALAALSLASTQWAAAARPHLLRALALSARTAPAFCALLHAPRATLPAHCAALTFEDTPSANALLPRVQPLRSLRRLELRELEWAALAPDSTAPLLAVFTELTELAVHRARFPREETLRRLIGAFPALEHLALSDVALAPCLCREERGPAPVVPPNLRSVTLDVHLPAHLPLLQWLATGCAKVHTVDIRGITRAAVPELVAFLRALPALAHLRLSFLEDVCPDDLAGLQTPALRSLALTAPSLATPTLLLARLRCATLALTLPSLGPAHLRRLPWAKLRAVLPPSLSPPSSLSSPTTPSAPSPSTLNDPETRTATPQAKTDPPALAIRIYGWPESILPALPHILAEPACLALPCDARAWSRTYALELDASSHSHAHEPKAPSSPATAYTGIGGGGNGGDARMVALGTLAALTAAGCAGMGMGMEAGMEGVARALPALLLAPVLVVGLVCAGGLRLGADGDDE